MSVSTIAAEQLALQGARCGKAARRDLTRGWPRKGSVYSTEPPEDSNNVHHTFTEMERKVWKGMVR